MLEAGRENGDIVGQRKGGGFFTPQGDGHEAHAGVEPQKGHSAVLTLARQTVALHALNDYPAGQDDQRGQVSGGTRPNVVPGEASATVDIRAATTADIDALLAASGQPWTRTLSKAPPTNGWRQRRFRPPWGPERGTGRWPPLAQRHAAALGFTVEAVATGGTSDGNFTAALGIPTLDGLAPIGGLDHSRMSTLKWTPSCRAPRCWPD